jgi:hypothetical protein
VNELWKDVEGYEGLYKISNIGRVRSVERYVKSSIQSSGERLKKAKILKPWNNGKGYLVVTFKKDGERKNKYIHRLVAEAFIPNPENKCDVNHIDGDKSNNKLYNLEWNTRQENAKHAWDNGLGANQYVHSKDLKRYAL